jgi:hypothetical protein
MKRFPASLFALAAASVALLARTDEQYVNNGTVTVVPQIDAKRVINRGSMNLTGSTKPFETSNTEVYLNEGSIIANPGIRFHLIDDSGFRRPSTLFSNSAAGLIATTNNFFLQASAPSLGGLGTPSILNIFRSVPDAFLSIDADKIVNRGSLVTSSGGEIRLKGVDVDLARSTLNVQPLPDGQSTTGRRDGGVTPLPGQLDTYWWYDVTRVDYDQLVTLRTATIPTPGGNVSLTNATVISPLFPYLAPGVNPADLPLPERLIRMQGLLGSGIHPFVWITTNDAAATSITNSTNQVITVLLVRSSDPNVLVEAKAQRGRDPNQPLPTVRLRLTSVGTNLITGKSDAVSFMLQNTFGSDYQNLLLSNRISVNTYQPTNFLMFKQTFDDVPNPFGGLAAIDTNLYATTLAALKADLELRDGTFGGQTSNAAFRQDIFTIWNGVGATNLAYTNITSTNSFAAYGATFSYQGSTIPRPANVEAAAPTNLSGRVVIEADKLDLSRTRIRAQGPVIIRANDVKTSAGSAIDAPFMNVELGSSTGDLNIKNLFQASIDRFAGRLQVFSSSWSNNPPDQTVTITNAPANPGDAPTTTDVTVALNAVFHVMIVDADFSASVQTPFVDLKLNSSNVTISDGIRVDRFAAVQTENLTIDGSLRLTGTNGGAATFNWDRTSFPTLKRLTNNGTIEVAQSGEFGTSESPYEVIVNNGSISAAGVVMAADDLIASEGSDITSRGGLLDITAKRLTVRGALSAPNSIALSGQNVVLGGGILIEGDYVDLSASQSLLVEDTGASLVTGYGMNLGSLPAGADVRGLTISTKVQPYQEAIHVWPGADVGPTAAGFERQSIAGLELDGGTLSQLTFRGTGSQGALYVSFLTISTNLATTNTVGGALALLDPSIFNVEDGFTVYFAGANVPPAQFEALTGGKFKFVSFAGAGSPLVTATVNGKPTQVSRSLRTSVRIDSDGDGVVNAYDADPFEGVVTSPNVAQDTDRGFVVKWEAAGWGSYEVQYSDRLNGEWKTLQKVANPDGTRKLLWVRDPIPESDGARAYRVLTK